MAKNTGTLVVDTIKTFDDTDKYAVVNSSDIKGGHHVVNYDTDRNNLVSVYPLRTETGMLVTVRSSAERGNQMTTYQLSGSSWLNYADWLSSIANIWTSGGTGNIWYNPPVGNVGIGLEGVDIISKLTVLGDVSFLGNTGYRLTFDPVLLSMYSYSTTLSILAPLRLGNNSSNLGLIVRPDSNRVGINRDNPATTLDVNGKTTIREQLIIDYSTTGGVGTWDKSGILIRNNNATSSEVVTAYQNISTGLNYWFTGLNQSDEYQVYYGASFGDYFMRILTTGEVNMQYGLTLGSYTSLSEGFISVGTTSMPYNSVIRVISDNAHIAGFEAYGAGQGTGYLYVGDGVSYGGGVLYNGDDSPAAIDPIDNVLYYRRTAGTNSTVFYYAHNSNNVFYNGSIYFASGVTGSIFHNVPLQNITIRAGLGVVGDYGQNPGYTSGYIALYTASGGVGGSEIYTGYGGDGGVSGAIALYTGNGGAAGGTDTNYGGVGGKSGDLTFFTGNGGASDGEYGGDSGNIVMYTGAGGVGGTANGGNGDIVMQYYLTARGNVLIGTATNTSNRRLKVNGVGEATDWIAISDIREKENIIIFENALDKVMQLNPVYFNFINGDDKSKKIGLIAQEVETIIPELIPPTIGDSIKGVSYMNLSAVLVKAIQEQNDIIEKLKGEINSLKLKINN